MNNFGRLLSREVVPFCLVAGPVSSSRGQGCLLEPEELETGGGLSGLWIGWFASEKAWSWASYLQSGRHRLSLVSEAADARASQHRKSGAPGWLYRLRQS